jgi:signal transduction histidine kinase
MQDRAVGNLTVGSSQDFPPVIAAIPITKRQTRIALGVIIFILSAVVIVAPFASVRLFRVDAFLPVIQAVMCVVDIITAAFLFAQYSIHPKYALLAVASAYVFSGLFAFIQTLAFPGAYSSTGLIGDGVDTAAWLFVLWHTTFLLGVIAYALLKDAEGAVTPASKSTTVVIAMIIICVLTATVGLTWIVIEGAGYLPRLFTSVASQTLFARGLDVFLWLLSIAALVLLFVRMRTILDLWLIVILLAWWPNFVAAIFVPVVRFSLGWYASRSLTLAASSMLLFVLLAETAALYSRLAGANILLRRERGNRLAGVEAATAAMAHELRQPLTGIRAQGAAGLNWLKRTPPELNEVRESLESIIKATGRADEIIAAIRGLFKKTLAQHTLFQINDVVREVLDLVQDEIRVEEITATVKWEQNLPEIYAAHTQIQQVIFNLVKNAIEAMRSVSPDRRRLTLVTGFNGKSDVSI